MHTLHSQVFAVRAPWSVVLFFFSLCNQTLQDPNRIKQNCEFNTEPLHPLHAQEAWEHQGVYGVFFLKKPHNPTFLNMNRGKDHFWQGWALKQSFNTINFNLCLSGLSWWIYSEHQNRFPNGANQLLLEASGPLPTSADSLFTRFLNR